MAAATSIYVVADAPSVLRRDKILCGCVRACSRIADPILLGSSKMRLTLMRYNSAVYPACAATSCCNAVGNMYLTSFAGLANLHGRNELNEDDADENVSIGATIVCWLSSYVR